MASTPSHVVTLVELGPTAADYANSSSAVAERELDRVDALLRRSGGAASLDAPSHYAEAALTERIEADLQRLAADLHGEVQRLLAVRRQRTGR